MALTDRSSPVDAAPVPFPSLAALRAAHAQLLKRRRELGETPELVAEIEAFLPPAQQTGVFLDDSAEREAAQSLLDYWWTSLCRLGREPPDATLLDFDPNLAPELPDELCPYRGLDAFHEADHPLFFGRERLVNVWVERLGDQRLLAVVARPVAASRRWSRAV